MKSNTKNKTVDIHSVSLGAHEGRLSAPPAREVVDYVYRPMFDQSLKSFNGLIEYHLAYVLMLLEQRIVSKQDTKKILRELLRLYEKGLAELNPSPLREELQPNVEAWLIQRLGYDVGGQLTTGRSRRECQMGGEQIVLRDKLLEVIRSALAIGRTLVDLSRHHVEDIIPYYTWFQQAEPITLGYFFAAYVEALLEDIKRLWSSYEEVDRSRAGVGQVVPTNFPINRKRLADLLGFQKQIDNSLGGYSSFDVEIVLLNGLTVLLTHMCRMSDDMYVWTAQEFGFIEFGDAFSGTSFIMPQKKNPHALRFVRLAATRSQATRELVTNLYLDTTPLIRGAISLSTSYCFDSIDEVVGCLRVLTAALPTVKFNSKRALEQAQTGYMQAVQLANTLVKEEGISFRSGHKIVGKLVRIALDKGLRPKELTRDLLNEVARQEIQREIKISETTFREALDPAAAIRTRVHGAGPAPKSTRRALNKYELLLTAQDQRLSKEALRVANYRKRLIELARKTIIS